MTTYQPEKLNLWDRIFNRYKTIPVEQSAKDWIKPKIFKKLCNLPQN